MQAARQGTSRKRRRPSFTSVVVCIHAFSVPVFSFQHRILPHTHLARSSRCCRSLSYKAVDGLDGSVGKQELSGGLKIVDEIEEEEAENDLAADLPPAPPIKLSTTLEPGKPLEYWHAGKVCFGTFLGVVEGKKSLKVSPSGGGRTDVIDAGQIIGVWEGEEMAGLLPESSSDWEKLLVESKRLVTRLPPRSLELQDLWKVQRSRGGTGSSKKGPTVGTLDVARWLFGVEGKWGKWRVQEYERKTSGSENVFFPSAAERIVAGQVVAGQLHRFKRVPSQLEDVEGNIVTISRGGFKAVDSSVIATNEAASFAALASQGPKARANLSDPAHQLVVHCLELLAMGLEEEDISPEAKRALKQLGRDATPSNARRTLMDMGLWVEGSVTKDGIQGPKKLIPWSPDILTAAKALHSDKNEMLAAMPPPGPFGSSLPGGRRDYRSAPFQVFCIDSAESKYYDDAISWNEEKGEVLIHIADVRGSVAVGSQLDSISQLRGGTQYLPKGALFMLPPLALKSLSFSAEHANEAVTVVMSVDPGTNIVTSSRVVLTLLPPVTPLSYQEANKALEAGNPALARLSLIAEAAASGGKRAAVGQRRPDGSVEMVRGNDGAVVTSVFENTPAHRLVDELLAMYTKAAVDTCKKAGVALPTLVGLGGRVKDGRARFATAPLRRYIDLVAQRQLVAASIGKVAGAAMSRSKVGGVVHELSKQRNMSLAARRVENGRLKVEALAAHCSRLKEAAGLEHAVLKASATGKGREVSIDGLGLRIRVQGKGVKQAIRSWQAGDPVLVRVLQIDSATNHVVAELANEEP